MGGFQGVKRPARGVDHPPSSSAKVKKRVERYVNSLPHGLLEDELHIFFNFKISLQM
jgi:hypothetical protein